MQSSEPSPNLPSGGLIADAPARMHEHTCMQLHACAPTCRALQQPAEAGCAYAQQRLLDLLRPHTGGIMWRTSKQDVAHELGIPSMVC